MRRIVVVGPHPPLVSFCTESFARRLEESLGIRATTVPFAPSAIPCTSAGALAEHPGAPWLLDADTVVWLRFAPRVYLRDWIAGILDRLLNGAAAAQRRRLRARLRDVCRAALASVVPPALDPRGLAAQQPGLRVVELNSPAQARFWLWMNEERRRERRGRDTLAGAQAARRV